MFYDNCSRSSGWSGERLSVSSTVVSALHIVTYLIPLPPIRWSPVGSPFYVGKPRCRQVISHVFIVRQWPSRRVTSDALVVGHRVHLDQVSLRTVGLRSGPLR